MSTIDQTSDQVFDSITGFDELAIAQHFGETIMELNEKNRTMFVRALAFVAERRAGSSDDDARTKALTLTFGELTDDFAEESGKEAGKDAPPEPSPETSLSSVS